MTRCDPNFNQRMKSHGICQNMVKIHNTIIDFAASFKNWNRIHIASTYHYGKAHGMIKIGVLSIFCFLYFLFFPNDQFKGRVMGCA